MPESYQRMHRLAHKFEATVPAMEREVRAYVDARLASAGVIDLRAFFADLVIAPASSALMGANVREALGDEIGTIYLTHRRIEAGSTITPRCRRTT